jgi:hypothetical protein
MRWLPGITGTLTVLSALFAPAAHAAPPAAATLVAPSGVIPNGSVTFTWQAADGATFYYLQVNDATASPRFTLWYPAGQACPANSATCSVNLTTGWADGAAIWWIQTWNTDGFGPWSAGMRFAVRSIPGAWSQGVAASDRFQLVMGGAAVLDRETGLVWQRDSAPSSEFPATWLNALNNCTLSVLGNALGWRLPSHEELGSLVDFSRTGPALPAGHPFTNVRFGPSDYYWTATTYQPDPNDAHLMWFGSGTAVAPSQKFQAHWVWCVRGGAGADNPR